jgi:hypothetical protein
MGLPPFEEPWEQRRIAKERQPLFVTENVSISAEK